MSNSKFDKPFILAMGPQRSGTSWLDQYLRARDDVCLPSGVKEIFFFDRHYESGADFYFKHFKPRPDHKIIMEISTTAFDMADAPQRVLDTIGDKAIKMLCPLRHPLRRSYSLYMHYKRYGLVSGNLRSACRDMPQILTSSRYAEHLENWFQVFGRDNVHIVFQEDLKSNPDFYVRSVCKFLGIEYQAVPAELYDRYNSTILPRSWVLAHWAQRGADVLRSRRLYFLVNAAKALGFKKLVFGDRRGQRNEGNILSKEDEQWLLEQLQPEVAKLEDLIGPIPQWKTREGRKAA